MTGIDVTSHEKGDAHLLLVTDNGIGVPASRKDRIFEYSGKDTGFNLFLSREILSITGISIKETGNEGTGARFEITLPTNTWRNGN